MSGKQEKKLRQLVRRNQNTLVNQSWDCFFDTISQMKFKYRLRLALKIISGKNIREEEKKKIGKQKMEIPEFGVILQELDNLKKIVSADKAEKDFEARFQSEWYNDEQCWEKKGGCSLSTYRSNRYLQCKGGIPDNKVGGHCFGFLHEGYLLSGFVSVICRNYV